MVSSAGEGLVCGEFLVSVVRIVNDPGCLQSRLLSHGRPPMWIRLQDHPATVLKHMALTDRNEAGVSVIYVLPYTVVTSHALHNTQDDCNCHSFRVHPVHFWSGL